MGTWESERGYIGDRIADILGEAIKKIEKELPHIRLIDLADAIEFVTRGFLTVEINDKMKPFGCHVLSLLENDNEFKTIPNRGQIKISRNRK